MSRLKKFLYLYFSAILLFAIITAVGAKTLGRYMSPIEYFFTDLQGFGSMTLLIFVISLFL